MLPISHKPWGFNETPGLPFFLWMLIVKFLLLIPRLWPWPLHYYNGIAWEGCQKAFYKKVVISFIQAPGFLWVCWHAQICSGISTLCTTIDVSWCTHLIWCRTRDEPAWLMKQSSLEYCNTSGTQDVIPGKFSERSTLLLTWCPTLASFDSSGSKRPNLERFFQDQQRRT